jgi:hypothetical protein
MHTFFLALLRPTSSLLALGELEAGEDVRLRVSLTRRKGGITTFFLARPSVGPRQDEHRGLVQQIKSPRSRRRELGARPRSRALAIMVAVLCRAICRKTLTGRRPSWSCARSSSTWRTRACAVQ